MWQIITIASTLVSLIAFALQIAGLFPTHKETLKTILIFSLGLLVGNLLGALKSLDVTLDLKGYSVLGLTVISVFAILFLAALTAVWVATRRNDVKVRNELYAIATILGGVAGVLLFATAMAHITPEETYSLQESLAAARWDTSNNHFNSAIATLQRAEQFDQIDLAEKNKIDALIKTIKQKRDNGV